MQACEHSDVCGLEALSGHDGKCILHSEDPDKDQEAFEEALEVHREDREGDFRKMVFPSMADFWDADFEEANFRGATFEQAEFWGATFEEADFSDATFEQADFPDATFNGGVSFSRAFETSDEIRLERADFSRSEFRGDVLFAGESEENCAFASGEIDFTNVSVASDADRHFRYADLSRCRFLRTDLRDVEFTGVKWCEEVSRDGWRDEWFPRVGVYDEVYEQNHEDDSAETDEEEDRKSEETPPWAELERLYRQHKRNHEERGDFPRGGDFHIGEKVARRKRAWKNFPSEWALLTVYRALSKYGERALPAVLWLFGVFFVCAVGYLAMGASTESICLASFCSCQDWKQALVLSGEATLFPVQSAGFQDVGPRSLNLIQRGLSPILIALLALALRQRVKR